MANIKDISWRKHFEEFLDSSSDARIAAEKRRDYRDLKQWSSEEIANLKKRQQAPIVFDQFSKKVDALVGLEVQRRTDPKAYPVSQKHAQAAEAITDALRYVESMTHFDDTATDVYEDKIVEGYGGAIVTYDAKKKKIEIDRIPWDRIYFDPYSRRKDFSDAKYIGITLWMDIDDAITINPGKREVIENLVSSESNSDTTFEDRPTDWINTDRKRVRVNQEYYEYNSEWYEVYYCGDTIISGPNLSPYLDCDGYPCNPIELQSDYIDRQNNRWGYTQRLIDVQDEINHRRSKALFLLSSKTVLAQKGAFPGMAREEVLGELRKGMSFLEYNPVGGAPPTIDSHQDLGQSQIAFYNDAKQAMDAVGINPELSGRTDAAISGRAFMARQQGGMMEVLRIDALHTEWKTRVYKQAWARMKQFWDEEKWIRVTNDDKATRFIGLNVPIRAIDKMLEDKLRKPIDIIKSSPPAELQMSSEQLEQFINQAIAQDPALAEVVEVRNNVVELDMDIIVEEAPETFVQSQEQFEVLAQLAATRGDPQIFEALLKLSSIPNKEEVLDMLKPQDGANDAQLQAQQQAQQMQMADLQAEIEKKTVENQKIAAETQRILSEIPLNEAKAKDELASAIERVGNTSQII